MNILLIMPERDMCGERTDAVNLARWLVRLGQRTITISSGEVSGELEARDVVCHRLPLHTKSLPVMLKTALKLIRILREEHIEIAHTYSRAAAWIVWCACRLTGVTFITTCYEAPVSLFCRVMCWGKRIIVPGSSVSKRLTRFFRVPGDSIRIVPGSVNYEDFPYISPDRKRKEGCFRVGIIGPSSPDERAFFIRAMARLASDVPGLIVRIAGEAPTLKSRKRLLGLARRLGFSGAIEFREVLGDRSSVLAELDLLVLPATAGGGGNRVVAEAHASGVPVAAARSAGIEEMIEDCWNGLLVSPNDEKALAGAAMRVYSEVEFSRMLARNAYHLIRLRFAAESMAREVLRVYEDAIGDRRILVRKFETVGAAVLSIPVLRALRGAFRDAFISVLAAEESKDVFGRCPYVDEVILGGGQVLSPPMKRRFDMVIDLPRQLPALSASGIRLDNPMPELWPSEEDRRYVDELLDSYGVEAGQELVGVNIAGSARWETKNWPVYHIAQLCARLAARDVRVVVTGLKKDLEDVMSLMMMTPCSQIINACGKTSVNQLACVIRRCSVYLSPDAAPLYIAASQNVPCVALFGPTDPRGRIPPVAMHVVIKKNLPCSPCNRRRCGSRRCMEGISPGEVAEAVEAFLGVKA